MSQAYSHFSAISRSPRHVSFSSLYKGSQSSASYDSSGISEQLKNLIGQVNSQSSLLSELASKVTGNSGQSAGQSILGGSPVGSLLSSVTGGGFSLGSLVKDIFPLGGLISGIAGLFSSTPTLAPLQQYDAPPALNFQAVLGANGSLSQSSSDQYGNARASSPGLSLSDAEGGPSSPYARSADGSLGSVAGDATTRYPGTLNLPELLGSLTKPSSAPPAPSATPAPSSAQAPALDSQPSAASTFGGGSSNIPVPPAPAFDANWFNDHGSLIASAVRNQLLNFHPIVDAINDL